MPGNKKNKRKGGSLQRKRWQKSIDNHRSKMTAEREFERIELVAIHL